jgi:hypothetical protein
MYLAKSAQGSFLVSTDYSGGYTSRVISGTSWLSIDDGGSSPGVITGQPLKFTVTENPNTTSREGVIEVTAGRLVQRVTVTQYWEMYGDVPTAAEDWKDNGWDEPLDGPYKLVLSRPSIVCPEDGITVSMNVTANTSEAGVQWTASTANGSWITNLTPSGAANGTPQPLSFTLTPNTTGAMRNGIITVSIIHRGNRLTQDIYVQQHFEKVIEFTLDAEPYETDQSVRQYFTLYSKMDWAIRLKSGGDPSGIFRNLYTPGGKANENGDSIYFVLKTPGVTGQPLTVTLEVYSPTGEFNTKEVVLTAKN